tara:strand:+ start:64 stop:303 length:240 start_codon:yes stop_codon:yes gene_type:complete
MAKKIKLKDVSKEAMTAGPTSGEVWAWELVRSLNSLKNDIDDQKHDKMMEWAAANQKKAIEISEMAELLKEEIIRMRTR